MRVITVVFVLSCLAACETVDTGSRPANQALLTTPSPPIKASTQPQKILQPVSPHIKLTSKQKKYLNETLPEEARRILEDAEVFELLGEVRSPGNLDIDSRDFQPNRIVRVTDEQQKKEILEAFYLDAATEDPPVICFEPHHGIRATKGDRSIEIEICFSCSRFEGKGSLPPVSGTIVRDGRRSEELFERIISSQSVDYSQ